MENPVKASPRAIMSHPLNRVDSESSSISSRDQEEDSFQEMPLKLVKREIENSTDDDFDDDLEEDEDDVTSAKQRILVNRPVIYPSSLTLSRQVNELLNFFFKHFLLHIQSDCIVFLYSILYFFLLIELTSRTSGYQHIWWRPE